MTMAISMTEPHPEKRQRYRTSTGCMTEMIQKSYIKREIERGNMPIDSLECENILSLEASDDPNDPVYFWQLHSILGKDPVRAIATNFYTRVFADQEDDDFRLVFQTSSDKNYHVLMQTFMYLDCFGGGRFYSGGESRLNFHHDTAAKSIMTLQGATKWTRYMREALNHETRNLDKIDPRARPAMNSFLAYFMDKYAATFEFDSSELYFGELIKPVLSNAIKEGDGVHKHASSLTSGTSNETTNAA